MPQGKKLSELNSITTIAPNDILLIGDVSEAGAAKTVEVGLLIKNSTSTSPGVIQLAGDLQGSATNPTIRDKASGQQLTGHINDLTNPHNVTPAQLGNDVPQWNADRIKNFSLNLATAPNDKMVLAWNAGAGSITFQTIDTTVADTTTTTKGIIRLAGDLAGTADAPTVPSLTTKANLVSPNFTGTPTAPTQLTTDNSTRLATTAYVTTAVTNASAGGATTASNVGIGGVGLFKQKTASDLEFKNINAASNKISITNDVTNSEIDIDIVESNISLTNLSGSINDAQHGNRSNGTLHAIATTTVAGFMSSADKTKLDGISGGASSPIASSTLTGTVKTDIDQADPIVYTRTTTDSLLATKEPTITTLPISKGGTNKSTVPTNGQLLIGNGTDYSLATLTQGANITITNTAGNITIASTASGTSLGRSTYNYTTSILTPNQTISVELPLGKFFHLFNLTALNPCWVRLYMTTADRTADAGRSIDVFVQDYNPNIKLIHEFIASTNLLDIDVYPIRFGANYENTVTENIPVAITNTSNVNTTITFSITRLVIEV